MSVVLSLIIGLAQPTVAFENSSGLCNYDSPIESYGKIKWSDEKARLDNLLVLLTSNDDFQTFIHIRLAAGRALAKEQPHISKMVRHLKWRSKTLDLSRISSVSNRLISGRQRSMLGLRDLGFHPAIPAE